MIHIENTAPPIAQPLPTILMEARSCVSIRTGNSDCVARFYPELYQLRLINSGVEERIDLGYSGSRLLERLVRNPGEVVDRDELISYAWSGRVVGQGSLNQQIYTLRQILADEKEREIIQTLPRRGYLINPKFVDLAPEAVQPVAQSITQIADTTAQPVTQAIVVPSGSQTLAPPGTKTIAPLLEPVAPALEQPPVADVDEDKKSAPRFTPAPAQPPRWRWATIGIGAALLALGSFTIGKISTQPVVKPASATAKQLTLTYAAHSPAELAELTPLGEQVERQLTPQLTQPLHLIVALHNEALKLICLRADGTAHTLHLDQSRLQTLAVTDLAQCLP